MRALTSQQQFDEDFDRMTCSCHTDHAAVIRKRVDLQPIVSRHYQWELFIAGQHIGSFMDADYAETIAESLICEDGI